MSHNLNLKNTLAPLFLLNAFFFTVFSINVFGLNFHIGFFGIALLVIFYLKKYGLNCSAFTKKFILWFIPLGILNVWVGLHMPCAHLHLKMCLTIIAFTATVLLAIEIALQSKEQAWRYVGNMSLFIMLIYLLGVILEMIFPEWWPLKAVYQKQKMWSGFATEPSFLAQLIPPLVLFAQLSKHIFVRGLAILLLMFFVLLSSSLTMIVLSTISILLVGCMYGRNLLNLKVSGLLIICPLIGFVIFVLLNPKTINALSPYIYHRIEFLYGSNATLNYSGLLFFQTWMDSMHSLKQSIGMGVGINQAGCFPRVSGDILELASRRGPIHQYMDGNVMMAKVIYEWGIIGILFFTFLTGRAVKIILSKQSPQQQIIFASVAVLTVATYMTRSNIYFEHTWWFLVIPYMIRYNSSSLHTNFKNNA